MFRLAICLLILSLPSWSLLGQTDSGHLDFHKSTTLNILDSPVAAMEHFSQTKPPKQELSFREGKYRTSENKTLVFFISLVCFALLGLLRFFYPRYIQGLFKIYDQGKLISISSSFPAQSYSAPKHIFTFIYFLTAGYCTYKLFLYAIRENLCDNKLYPLFIACSIVLLSYIYRIFAVYTMAWMFRFRKKMKPYFQYLVFTNQIIGILLLPVSAILVLCVPHLESLVLSLAGLILVSSLVIKMVSSLSYLKHLPNIRVFHFILYLCVLEIIPFAVLGRWMVNNF